MRNIVEETYDRLINKWGSKEYKGIGTINCVPPVDYCEIISRIISLMRNKNDNIQMKTILFLLDQHLQDNQQKWHLLKQR